MVPVCVKVTDALPGVDADGVRHTISEVVAVTLVQVSELMVTTAVGENPDPETFRRVPPAKLPLVGAMLVIRVLYVKVWLPLARPTPATLTSTSWVPVPAPKVHTSWVGLAVVTGQSTPPIVTVLSAGVAPKEVPVMVRVAPEKSDDGEMAVTDGVLVDFHSNPQEPSQRVGISLT